jgi:hypothetical protein
MTELSHIIHSHIVLRVVLEAHYLNPSQGIKSPLLKCDNLLIITDGSFGENEERRPLALLNCIAPLPDFDESIILFVLITPIHKQAIIELGNGPDARYLFDFALSQEGNGVVHCDDVKYFEPADVVADDDRLRDGWPGIVVDLRCVAHAQQQHSAVVVAEHLEYPASRTETPLEQIVKEDAYVYE